MLKYSLFPSSCIKLFDIEKVNWIRAKAVCVASGSKLIEVNSRKESNLLKSLKSKQGLSYFR